MRSFGFIILFLGGLIAYLAAKGKAGAAFSTLLTGQIPLSPNTAPATGGIYNPSGDNPIQKKVEDNHPIMSNPTGVIGSKAGWGG